MTVAVSKFVGRRSLVRGALRGCGMLAESSSCVVFWINLGLVRSSGRLRPCSQIDLIPVTLNDTVAGLVDMT